MQCHHRVAAGSETPHIVSHYLAGHSEKNVRLRVLKFAEENKEYVAEVASGILSKKGQHLDDYLWCLLQPNTPFDEIALFLISRCLRIHTRVFAGDTVWSTKKDGDASGNFDFNLVYKGALLFFDTVAMDKPRPVIGGVQCQFIENDDFDDTMPVEIEIIQIVPPVKPANNIKKEKDDDKVAKSQPQPRGKKRKAKKGQPASKKKKPRRQKPKPLSLQLRSSSKSSSVRTSKTSAKAREAAKLVERSVETQQGLLSVTTYGIKRRKPKRKKIKCHMCSEIFKSQRAYNRHMTTSHPDVQYKCRYCGKCFKTYNGRFKHTMIHTGYRFECDVCLKTFPFPSRYHEHMRRHSKKGMLPCLHRGCGKKFTTRRAMKEHMKTHTDDVLFCHYEECADDKDGFRTQNYLRQHIRGVHLKNYKTHCGLILPNPGKRQRHQNGCADCLEKKKKPVRLMRRNK